MQEIRTPTRFERLAGLKSHDNLVIALKASAITVAVIALFFQDLNVIFADALSNETTSYILAIPFLFAYFVYRKRKMLRAVIPLENKDQTRETRHLPQIAGILLSVTATLVYWHGSHTFTPLEYHMFALPMFAAGLTLILFNPQTLRQLAFPIAFLLFLMPPPSEILYGVGSTLSGMSSGVSSAIVNAVGIPSALTSEYGNPTITITRPDGTPLHFTVDLACSGIYSLIGFFIFAIFIAYITRDRLWKKTGLLMLGIPMMYLLNTVRISAILVIGYHYGEELALQIFHLVGGWILIFLGTLLLLAISEKLFRTHIFVSPPEKCLHRTPTPDSTHGFCLSCGKVIKPAAVAFHRIDAIKLVAITLAIVLLLFIQAPVFALTRTQPIVVVDTPGGTQVSTGILPEIPNYNLSFVYRDSEFEKMTGQDMSLVYKYSPLNESDEPISVALEIGSTLSSLHGWEFCLVTWPMSQGFQPLVTQIALKDIQLIQNPPVLSHFFVFTYTATGLTQAVLYWYETAMFTVNSTSRPEYLEISLVIYPENSMLNLPGIENQLVTVGTEIANYLEPIKTWSQITMLVSQNGINLAAATSAILIATVIVYFVETRKQRRVNKNTYEKLSRPNRQMIDVLLETENHARPTLDNIKTAYQETIGHHIDSEQLLQKLTLLENSQIIKRSVANVQDEPTQIWKIHRTLKQGKRTRE
jgi:exosortase